MPGPPRNAPRTVSLPAPRPATPGDGQGISALLRAAGHFTEPELVASHEVLAEALTEQAAHMYSPYLLEEPGGPVLGYICTGAIPLALDAFEILTLAVHPDYRRRGLASRLVATTAETMRGIGGRLLMVDTSSAPEEVPARGFFVARGFQCVGQVPDFYGPATHKFVYCLRLQPARRRA